MAASGSSLASCRSDFRHLRMAGVSAAADDVSVDTRLSSDARVSALAVLIELFRAVRPQNVRPTRSFGSHQLSDPTSAAL